MPNQFAVDNDHNGSPMVFDPEIETVEEGIGIYNPELEFPLRAMSNDQKVILQNAYEKHLRYERVTLAKHIQRSDAGVKGKMPLNYTTPNGNIAEKGWNRSEGRRSNTHRDHAESHPGVVRSQ